MSRRQFDAGSWSTSKINKGHLAQHPNNSVALLEQSYVHNQHELDAESQAKCTKTYDQTPIVNALNEYLKTSSIRLHIPGHARGEGILQDLKEIIGTKAIKADTTDDFNNLGQLHPASGPIGEAQELAAQAFQTKHTFFLINGSSVGNLALATTVTNPTTKILVARNCHRSIISGLSLTGATPIWIMPKAQKDWGVWGAVNPDEIEQKLIDNPDISVVWITNPTYEGIVSDIAAISKICKKYGVTFIVDEAHGCHWSFSDETPTSAIRLGADAVVHSLHKTGGSFSQSSMLHVTKSSSIDVDMLHNNLRVFQSTSPSYLLLASLDSARAFLDSKEGRIKLTNIATFAKEISNKINKIPGCKCLNASHGYINDPSKIYICIQNLSGKKLKEILEQEYKIEIEAKTDKGILALANIGNTELELQYLYEAIKNIASRNLHHDKEEVKFMPFSIPEMVRLPREAFYAPKEKVKPIDAIGRISAEIIAECPPGIPILVPGEKIQLEHLYYLKKKEFLWVTKS